MLKKASKDYLVELNLRAFDEVCKMLRLSARIEDTTAFVTASNGNRVVMPLEKLMRVCRIHINNIVNNPKLYTPEEVAKANNIKILFDIPL